MSQHWHQTKGKVPSVCIKHHILFPVAGMSFCAQHGKVQFVTARIYEGQETLHWWIAMSSLIAKLPVKLILVKIRAQDVVDILMLQPYTISALWSLCGLFYSIFSHLLCSMSSEHPLPVLLVLWPTSWLANILKWSCAQPITIKLC